MIDLEKIKEILVENWQAVLVMLLGRETNITFLKKELVSKDAALSIAKTGQFFVQFEVQEGLKAFVACKNMFVSIVSNLMMGIEAFKGEITADDRDAFLEALNQMFSSTTVSFREKAGLELKFSGFKTIDYGSLEAALGDRKYYLFESQFSIAKAGEEKMAVIIPEESFVAQSPKKVEKTETAEPNKKKQVPAEARIDSEKINLLLDLELPVMVRIGSTELKIIDIMKLGIGSIIELEKHVDDPVELLVNDRLVARGEVVIYENNFGLRILEVVSKEERIKSLGG